VPGRFLKMSIAFDIDRFYELAHIIAIAVPG